MDNITIKIKYATLFVGIGLTIALIFGIKLWGGSYATIENYIKILGSGIALTALVYAAINVHLLFDINKKNLEFKKKEYSASLITQFNSPTMTKLSVISHALKKEIKDLTPEEVADLLARDENKKIAIVAMLNFYEKLAISIEHEIADEELLKDFFRGIIRNTYHVMKNFIDKKRIDNENQRIFAKFENLAKRWD